jgi:heme oxygenase
MPLRDTLEEATREEHLALEALLALDRPGLTLAEYQDYLRLSHAFYGRVEPALRTSRALAALGLDMGLRNKRGWLEADLAWFGVAPLEAEAPCIPDIEVGSRALGCAYVLEGATLGGHALHGMLAPRFDLAPGRGATFLSGYGARTGAMWRGFVAALEEAGRGGIDERACIGGARDTFASLGNWFRQRGWAPT